jgi:hypothetical protein
MARDAASSARTKRFHASALVEFRLQMRRGQIAQSAGDRRVLDGLFEQRKRTIRLALDHMAERERVSRVRPHRPPPRASRCSQARSTRRRQPGLAICRCGLATG